MLSIAANKKKDSLRVTRVLLMKYCFENTCPKLSDFDCKTCSVKVIAKKIDSLYQQENRR